MSRFYYDLHIHSCLSPCGDDDNTPNNIAGMAKLSELDIVALTDHNTVKNCPAFFKAAERYGIIPIAGMELTTSEDIHIVCLFEQLSHAISFEDELQKHRTFIKNRPKIFGEQKILDENDELVGMEEYLLPNATSISIEDVSELVMGFHGVCYPAHIDRAANGIIAVLGTFPENLSFSTFEIRDKEKYASLCELYPISGKLMVVSSDAHYLADIRDKDNFFMLDAPRDNPDAVRKELFRLLRQQEIDI